MIIGTAGHIDHGKTSLVQAITGVDADRLHEEKRRGITIDLGFAYWPQQDGSSIGFVDVPGHESYIHNMLAGITGVSGLLLVVAANDGIKPQTLEHLEIAHYLGLQAVVVALTKSDLVDSNLIALRQQEISHVLAGFGLANSGIIPVSVRNQTGLEELKAALRQMAKNQLAKDQPAQSSGLIDTSQAAPFVMAIDRVFSLDGTGTIVTGGVQSGRVATDARLILSPLGREIRIRGIHAQNRATDHAHHGQRAALNLASIRKDEIGRGDRLVSAELHNPTSRFDVNLSVSPALARPLQSWSPVHLHCGTGHWPARLVPLEQEKLQPGCEQLVQIVLDKPVALFSGDRFIIRNASATQTIGGGVVLDRHAPERNRRKPERLAALRAMASRNASAALPSLLLLSPYAIDVTRYAADHAMSPSAFETVRTQQNLMLLGNSEASFLMDAAILLLITREMRELLHKHHAAFPDQAGLTAERLRLMLGHRLVPAVFSAVAHHLVARREIAQSGAWLRLPDHVPRLSAEHEAIWAKIQPQFLGDARFRPPRVAELAELLRMRQESIRGLMKRLARRGDVQEIAEDHFVLVSAVGELAAMAAAVGKASPDGWFNAATYRDRIGIGRKMAILILEFFDRQGVTIRKGDLRLLDQNRLKGFLGRRN